MLLVGSFDWYRKHNSFTYCLLATYCLALKRSVKLFSYCSPVLGDQEYSSYDRAESSYGVLAIVSHIISIGLADKFCGSWIKPFVGQLDFSAEVITHDIQ